MININFSKRLKDLREESGLTQTKLGKEIGVDQRSISFYELGKYEPDLQTLINIANFFDVSTDYLLGLTNNPKKDWENKKYEFNINNIHNLNIN